MLDYDDLDGDLSDGKIVSSNSYSLASLVQENGGIPIMLGIAQDTPQDLRAHFEQGMGADIIISSGGVSVGDYDFVLLDTLKLRQYIFQVTISMMTVLIWDVNHNSIFTYVNSYAKDNYMMI